MLPDRDLSHIRVVPVSRLASYLKRKLEADKNLASIGVEGEISNWRLQPAGHANFDVKDRDAVLNCFAFASDAATFPALKNGDAVVVYGAVGTYEKKSTYQLRVHHVELAGLGKLFARYDELKRRLEAEGLFDERRKRALPRFPFRVALVGSPSGDGTRDFLTQARHRAPHVAVTLVETPVQGDVAPQIAAALARACTTRPDLVVLARGGGSFEDLFVFSDERVVRAVAACAYPIVTAIGHDADVSLADLAADRRAATPSTAAQTILPSREDVLRELRRDGQVLARTLEHKIGGARRALERIEYRSPLADPARLLATRKQEIDELRERAASGVKRRIERSRTRLVAVERRFLRATPEARLVQRRERFVALSRRLIPAAARGAGLRRAGLSDLARKLEPAFARVVDRSGRRLAVLAAHLTGVDPAAPLRRGYAIVEDASGALVVAPEQAPPGTRLHVRLARGELSARVEADHSDGGEQIGLF